MSGDISNTKFNKNQCFLSWYAFINETDGQLELHLFFNSHPWWIGKRIILLRLGNTILRIDTKCSYGVILINFEM
jgi:hypothetical protein